MGMSSIWLIIKILGLLSLGYWGLISLYNSDWSRRHWYWTFYILLVSVLLLGIIGCVIGIPQQVIHWL